MAMKKRILAIPAVATEISVKPNRPATIDMMKKNKAHLNMIDNPHLRATTTAISNVVRLQMVPRVHWSGGQRSVLWCSRLATIAADTAMYRYRI
jgi:hypothetical protein